jgi:hypothetical protein
MEEKFTQVESMKYWVQKILPQVYDDSLSYQEVLYKLVAKLNKLIENVNNIPDFIRELILEFIKSGEIGDVVSDIIANFMLNVKNPPSELKGAVGDGSADDTEAIQGCIDYANAHGGKCIYFPSGSYLTQSITLKDNVSLCGFDLSTTRLVLKGGATKALITGTVRNNSICKISLDGNMDIQVNNINLIDINAGDLIIDSVSMTDGYNLLKLVASGDIIANNLIFDTAVVDALNIIGTGIINFNNLVFKKLSALNGRYIINNTISNAVFKEIYSIASTAVAINNTGNYCIFEGQIINAVKVFNNDSVGTYYNFYSKGSTIEHKIDTSVYVQEAPPTDVHKGTIWYAIQSVDNIGGGTVIGNATTSEEPPTTNYWFDPIN